MKGKTLLQCHLHIRTIWIKVKKVPVIVLCANGSSSAFGTTWLQQESGNSNTCSYEGEGKNSVSNWIYMGSHPHYSLCPTKTKVIGNERRWRILFQLLKSTPYQEIYTRRIGNDFHYLQSQGVKIYLHQ